MLGNLPIATQLKGVRAHICIQVYLIPELMM